MENLTDEKVAELKKHAGRDIHLLNAPEQGKACVIKQPFRKEIAAAAQAMATGKNNPTKFTESILRTCFIYGDDPFADPDDRDGYLMTLTSLVNEIIEVKDGEIKKL